MELTSTSVEQPDLDRMAATLQAACGRIAPLWPLESFVAVNPYLGLLDHRFDDAARTLSYAAGARTTMAADYYRAAHDAGRIEDIDLDAALQASGRGTTSAPELLALADGTSQLAPARILTLSEVAATATGRDWCRLRTDRVSAWAAAHFDRGQALWRSADPALGVFASWKQDASLDRTPDIMGLKGFRTTIRSLPEDPVAAAALALDELGVTGEAVLPFVHAVLMRMGGWAAFASRVAWDAALRGDQDDSPVQFAAVLLCWELGIWRAAGDPVISTAWARARARLAEPTGGDESLGLHLLLQDALDGAAQRRLVAALSRRRPSAGPAVSHRARVQAVFCIDVRSEVFRRNFEAAGEEVETLGFAGFFGLPLGYLPLAHTQPLAQCPVLLTPSHVVDEALPDPVATAEAVARRRLDHHVTRAWKSFKMGAVSCFSFVGPVGLAYLPKLVTDGHGLTRPVPRPETEGLSADVVAAAGPSLVPSGGAPGVSGIDPAARLDLVEGTLRGMSLVSGFAPIVLLAGHGSSTVNNPYGTGLDCGACGGHTGEVSARVTATMLNDPEVRVGLGERGIDIPDDTWFVPALHDTTTDDVTLFDTASVPATHAAGLAEVAGWLADAGHGARSERAGRLGLAGCAVGDVDDAVRSRARDWAQVRPEWGLAGCRAFIAAPRRATRDVDLGGRAFLHSYDHHHDDGFAVLETIMTAPMIVASWISLQYYASTVDNERFGSGNKTLHNVVGRIGVLEGNGGDLRSGLPWQSVHDGAQLQHEPLRLQVVVAAPTEAMSAVISRHDMVRDLCDNQWLALYACDDDGTVTHRYAGGLRWDPVDSEGRQAAGDEATS